LVTPLLRQLSGELNETSGFSVRIGDAEETIASAASGHALVYTMKVGERAPLYAVSSGKITLGQMSLAEFSAYLSRVKFEPITSSTLSSKRRLRDEIQSVRQDGFAYSREEFTPGITGVATAVQHNGRFFGALNLAVPTARFAADQDILFRRLLRSTASALGQVLPDDREHLGNRPWRAGSFPCAQRRFGRPGLAQTRNVEDEPRRRIEATGHQSAGISGMALFA